MRLIDTPLLLAIAVIAVTGCAAATSTPVSSSGPQTIGSARTSAAPSATDVPSATPIAPPVATAVVASPSADPAESPSIDALFRIGDGDRRLAMVCWGQGSPTVLLETGGANIDEWSGTGLVRQLASRTRVCTYDRAGTGASDPPPFKRRDAEDVASDLKALLTAAKVDGPYVLVGRSFGGMVVTHFAETMPDGVQGVVVLDTPAPSATFTEESEPGLVWDYPDNTERLDVVGGFENRFAKDPPKVNVPVLVVTPQPGEASAEDEAFWLQISPDSRQVELACDDGPIRDPCTDEIVKFVTGLT